MFSRADIPVSWSKKEPSPREYWQWSIFFLVLVVELRASLLLGRHSTTKLFCQPGKYLHFLVVLGPRNHFSKTPC
jgi:hypothetical protein